MPKGAVLHIACNTQKESGGFLAPVFADGSFKFIPIPEKEYYTESSWTYDQLSREQHLSLHELNNWLPRGWRWDHAHYDPEFISFTWGDYRNKRTFQARKLQAGDYYFFIASLRYREQSAKKDQILIQNGRIILWGSS